MTKTCLTILLALVSTLLLYSCQENTPTAGLSLLAPPPALPEPLPLDPVLQLFVDDYERYFIQEFEAAGLPAAAVAIVKDSTVIYLRGFGNRSAGSSDSTNAYTVFRIGSLSKGFAGVLTGILVEKGFLNWNDPVQQYYPEFLLKDREQSRRTEVRHLLSHTVGLPYHAFDNLIEQGFDRETIFKNYFPGVKLFGKEGEYYRYQNAAYSVIEPVLEAATGKSYAELLSEYIFQPGGMISASSDYFTMKERQNKALPHYLTESGWVTDTISKKYYGFPAAGGINASIADMSEWLKILLGSRPDIVSDTTLDYVFHPVIKTGMEKSVLPGWIGRDSASYAMGWRVLEKGPDTLIYHAGFVNNFYSEIALNRKEGIGICILTNASSSLKGSSIRTFFDRWKKQETDCPPPPVL